MPKELLTVRIQNLGNKFKNRINKTQRRYWVLEYWTSYLLGKKIIKVWPFGDEYIYILLGLQNTSGNNPFCEIGYISLAVYLFLSIFSFNTFLIVLGWAFGTVAKTPLGYLYPMSDCPSSSLGFASDSSLLLIHVVVGTLLPMQGTLIEYWAPGFVL